MAPTNVNNLATWVVLASTIGGAVLFGGDVVSQAEEADTRSRANTEKILTVETSLRELVQGLKDQAADAKTQRDIELAKEEATRTIMLAHCSQPAFYASNAVQCIQAGAPTPPTT